MIVEKHTRYSIILTPTGNFKKVYGAFREEVGQEISIKPGITVPRAISAVAALMIIILSLALPVMMGRNQAYAYVTLDINPSVEFAINEDYLVLKAHPYNQEADRILSGMAYKGQAIKSVLAEFTRSALSLWSPDDTEPNHVLVSFYSKHTKDEHSAEAELMHIMEAQRELLQSSGKQAHINSVVVDTEIFKEAHRLGVSAGRLMETEKKIQEQTEKEIEKEIEVDSKKDSKKDPNEDEAHKREGTATKKAANDEKDPVQRNHPSQNKESNQHKNTNQWNDSSQKKECDDKDNKENRGQANKKAQGKGQKGKEEKSANKKKNQDNRKSWNNKQAKKKNFKNPKSTQSKGNNPNRGFKQSKSNKKGKGIKTHTHSKLDKTIKIHKERGSK